LKITSKCGEVEIDLNLNNNTVTMRVVKQPDWLRGRGIAYYQLHVSNNLRLRADGWPELFADAVCLRGWDRDCDDCSTFMEWGSVRTAASYFKKVGALIETFDSRELPFHPDKVEKSEDET